MNRRPNFAKNVIHVVAEATAERVREEQSARGRTLITVIFGKARCLECNKNIAVDLKNGRWVTHEKTPGKTCYPRMKDVRFLYAPWNQNQLKNQRKKKKIKVQVNRDQKAHCWLCHREVIVSNAGRKFRPHVNQHGNNCEPSYEKHVFVGITKSQGIDRFEKREESRLARMRRRREEQFTMRDEWYQPGLQDFDVEDTGKSKPAYLGGLPYSGKRR